MFPALAHAAKDTVEALGALEPHLKDALKDIPPGVLEKLTSEQLHDLLEQAMESRIINYVPIVSTIAFFGTLALILYWVISARRKQANERHEEVLAMIDKGIYEPPPQVEPVYRKERYLLRGIILGTVGLGLVVYYVFEPRLDWVAGIGLPLLLVGAGFILFYRVLAKKEEKEKPPSEMPV
jgi:hypothetical protein